MKKHKIIFKNLLVSSYANNHSHKEYQLMIQCKNRNFTTYLVIEEINNKKSESIDYLYCPYCGDKLNKKELIEDE